jgi:hypothetical protein
VIKEKMKNQLVAILIALVVISSLLTVSVLSEEAYKSFSPDIEIPLCSRSFHYQL